MGEILITLLTCTHKLVIYEYTRVYLNVGTKNEIEIFIGTKTY
jgi:hypothetical protein